MATKTMSKASKNKAAAKADLRKFQNAAELLKKVSDSTRLQILVSLQEGEQNVTEICETLGNMSQPAVSHHLALLRHGGMVQPRRSGKSNYYGLTEAGGVLVGIVEQVLS